MGRSLQIRQGERTDLADRLEREKRIDLATPLRKCAETMTMTCTACGIQQDRRIEMRCKKRWCPVCQSQLAATKALRVKAAWGAMQWPLFLTLTIPNTIRPEGLKELSQSFSAFRRTKWWKDRNVKGGVACFEVTNKGNGWHPHLHALVDCRWLASTPEPNRHQSKRENKRRSFEAAEELSKTWGKYIGVPSGAIVWSKRAHDDGVAQEISKYAVKGSDLLEVKERISPLIDVMSDMRLMSTWGSVRPLGPMLAELEEKESDGYEGAECDCCGAKGECLPDHVIEMMKRA